MSLENSERWGLMESNRSSALAAISPCQSQTSGSTRLSSTWRRRVCRSSSTSWLSQSPAESRIGGRQPMGAGGAEVAEKKSGQ